ncbi:Calx-beta domain-containing protein [Deltaproteobacteria bacterium TL4]
MKIKQFKFLLILLSFFMLGCNDPDPTGTKKGAIRVGTISGDTTEGGGVATFTVKLKTSPSSNVKIPVFSSNTDEGMVSPSELTFTPNNWNSKQVVLVSGRDDDIKDGDQEYKIILGNSESEDGEYNNVDPDDMTLKNLDDDTAGVVISELSRSTSEKGLTATFSVKLSSEPISNVRILVSSSNTNEGTVDPGKLDFSGGNWDIEQLVTVTGVDDKIADDHVKYTIQLSAALSDDPNYQGLDPKDVQAVNMDDEVPGFIIVSLSGNTLESAGTAIFTVQLTTKPAANVTIAVSSNNTQKGTVTPSSLTFTPANWSAPQSVSVTGVDDSEANGNQSYTIILAAAESSDSGYNGLNPADVDFINIDDETAGFIISGQSTQSGGNITYGVLSTTESGATATFTVVLSSKPLFDVTIPTIASNDTTEGEVSVSSLTFTSANWNIPQTVTVTGLDDVSKDGNQSYKILLGSATSSDPDYQGVVVGAVLLTNLDNDTAGFTLGSVASTMETGTSTTLTIRLTSKPESDVSIAVSSNLTTEGTVSPSSLMFTTDNWNVDQTLTITGVDDDVLDGNQPYTIVLGAAISADPNFNGVDPRDVTLTNLDDETAGVVVSGVGVSTSGGQVTYGMGSTSEIGIQATFTVQLQSKPSANVSFPLTSSNTNEGTVSPASLTFTTNNWDTPQTVTVTGQDDDYGDGTKTYQIQLGVITSDDLNYNRIDPSDVSVNNVDDEVAGFTISSLSGNTTESGGTATFTIRLTAKSEADVIISVVSSDPGEGSVSASSLTFTAATWNVLQTVTVTGVDDILMDGDQSYNIELGSSSQSAIFNILDPADLTLSNVDETPGVVVGALSNNTTETGGTATFTARLNTQPTADVTVPIATSDTTEGTVSPASLTFTSSNWNTTQNVTITGVDDLLDDGDQSYTITLGPTTSGDPRYVLTPSVVSVSNTDDDTAGITVSAAGNMTTTEGGGTATFTVVLDSQPTANVTIALATSDATEGAVSVALTFTTSNWNTAQNVTIIGVDDLVDDGDQSYTIILGPTTSTDANYSAINPADISLSNTDNDTAGITVNAAGNMTTTEGGGTATFTVVLDSEPTANVTIGISSSNPAEGTVSVSSLVFTSANWSTVQTVTITGKDDAQVDGTVNYTIQLGRAISVDSKYSVIDADDVSLSNQDNDS